MDRSIFGLEDKVAIIAGGGQGIGRSSTLLLAQAGAHTAIVDIEPERGEAVVSEVEAAGRKAITINADLRTPAGVEEVIRQTLDRLGDVHVLVNIIAANQWVNIEEATPELWDEIQSGTLRYVFLTSTAAARAMMARGHGGRIVSIASMSGIAGAPRHAPYGAAKAGLIHLTKSMAVEWGPKGIRTNAVAPGSVMTPRAIANTPPGRDETLKSVIPLGRRGIPDDIGKAVLFFASDLSGYVTGQTLVVDGGVTCNFPVPPK